VGAYREYRTPAVAGVLRRRAGQTSYPAPTVPPAPLVRVFRPGWICIRVALRNHRRLPPGRLLPELWPSAKTSVIKLAVQPDAARAAKNTCPKSRQGETSIVCKVVIGPRSNSAKAKPPLGSTSGFASAWSSGAATSFPSHWRRGDTYTPCLTGARVKSQS